MSAASGAAFTRPLHGADHVSLLHTAATSTSSACYANGILGSRRVACLHPHPGSTALRKKLEGLAFLSQRDWTGSSDDLCSYSWQNIEQQKSLRLVPRNHVREGGADSESKGSNPWFGSGNNAVKKESSLLLSLVLEIQPLDVSHISKEVSADSSDAMKRTISGMLGLLPSDQFHVMVETSREPLAKLFVSSMMTGYTLRNAEYRLCLQKSLEFSGVGGEVDAAFPKLKAGREDHEFELEVPLGEDKEDPKEMKLWEDLMAHHPVLECIKDTPQFPEPINDDARHYIQYLQQKLASVTKELEECKRINTGLQVQSLVGEEKNDLLDYLRSLSPEKVAELSQPTSPEVEGVIQQVITGLLDSPATKLQYKDTHKAASPFNASWADEGSKAFSSSPLQSPSAVTVSRDHLARLLFWCMLLGHHMRGLEYRLELSRALSLCGDLDPDVTKS